MGMRIQKNDRVVVISGEDKGKEGKVLKTYPKKQRVIVEGVNFIKRHTKPSQTNQQGGIIEKEAPIHLSNLLVICEKCRRGVKVSTKRLENGRNARICKRCKEMISAL